MADVAVANGTARRVEWQAAECAPAQSRGNSAGRPVSLNPPGVAPFHDDIPDDAILPAGRAARRAAQRPGL